MALHKFEVHCRTYFPIS